MLPIVSPAETFLCGEGNDGRDGTNARYHLGALPARWLGDENSPARRHVNTANYLYADGHVKALRSEQAAIFNVLPARQKEPIP